ncbi:hypothetical protein BGX30_014523, partial [Mortierella sp. GBA39]
MFWIYPGIAKNSGSFKSLIDAMPEGVGKAFGLENGFGSIGAFISGEYYGLLYLLILSIFCILVSTQLIAKLVNQGSMAYLLSAPTTRTKGVITIGFFSLNLIGKISGQLSWMRHISVFSLFDPGEIVGKTADWPVSVAVLAGLGAAAFAAGMIIFRKRSLPL